MRQTSPLLPAALLSLALIACTQSDPNNIAIDEANNVAATADDVMPSENAATPPEDNVAAGNDTAPVAAVIPAQYRGRWGLVAADCTSTRGDAKGLIAVDDKTIKFYEARATLREQRPAIATSFSGLFGFTGEGQTWERVETLTVTGDRMERRSTTPQGDAGDALTYTRCKA